VQAGDTLLGIALQFNVTLADLTSFNDLAGQDIYPGDVLLIPPAGAAPAETTTDKTVSYRVQEGESFYSIAARFGISPENLQNANPGVETLQPGDTIKVPWDGVHIVEWGDTLTGLVQQYNVTVDELVQANLDLLDFENLDNLQVGWQLTIPIVGVGVSEGYDCSPQGPRTAVIEHTVQNGERLFCLSTKFGVDMSTILYANPQIVGEGALRDGVTILIPPNDGALYTIQDADVENGITLADIATWYSVRELNSIIGWDGNPVPVPLQSGQQLFIPGADPLAGAFNSGVLVAFNAGEQESLEQEAPVVRDPAGIPAPPPVTGDAPFEGLDARHWSDPYARNSPGYCDWAAGSGWSGSLTWPIDSRDLPAEQRFRPGHAAIDINAPEGTAVYAAESGTVVWAGFSLLGGGSKVILSHGNLWRTHYVHLSDVAVGCGQFVAQGSLIGYSGQTGTSWPHLHFAVNQAGQSFDPCGWLGCP